MFSQCYLIVFRYQACAEDLSIRAPKGAFPQETLTAGAETRSKAYADLGSGISASRSANVPDPLVGVGFQLGGAEPVSRKGSYSEQRSINMLPREPNSSSKKAEISGLRR